MHVVSYLNKSLKHGDQKSFKHTVCASGSHTYLLLCADVCSVISVSCCSRLNVSSACHASDIVLKSRRTFWRCVDCYASLTFTSHIVPRRVWKNSVIERVRYQLANECQREGGKEKTQTFSLRSQLTVSWREMEHTEERNVVSLHTHTHTHTHTHFLFVLVGYVLAGSHNFKKLHRGKCFKKRTYTVSMKHICILKPCLMSEYNYITHKVLKQVAFNIYITTNINTFGHLSKLKMY